ncbi:MAG: hypothetical protein V4654_05580 [Bdellovibrionota bacterium]
MKKSVLKTSFILVAIFFAAQAQAQTSSISTLAGLNLKIAGGLIKSNCSIKNPQRCESTSEVSILPYYRQQIQKKAAAHSNDLDIDLYNYDLEKSVALQMGRKDTQFIAHGDKSVAIEYVPEMGMNFLFVHNDYVEETKSYGPVERMEVKCTAKTATEIICSFPNNLGYLKFAVD